MNIYFITELYKDNSIEVYWVLAKDYDDCRYMIFNTEVQKGLVEFTIKEFSLRQILAGDFELEDFVSYWIVR